MTIESKEKNAVKARLVILAQMLYQKTDQEHPMTGRQILEYLAAHDVPTNEKTLRGDIRLLQDLGMDIVKVISRPNLYFWGERMFEMPELKLLIDAVGFEFYLRVERLMRLN